MAGFVLGQDLTELFVVEKKASLPFLKFFELLLTQSGSLFEAQSFTQVCEVSRPTIQSYLSILETTLVANVIRPYHVSAATEIKSQPKVYGFDIGFVCYARGIESLRDDDRGYLLEHLVLNELFASGGRDSVFHWRDKQKHEVDFILKRGRSKAVTAIECKLQATKLDATGLRCVSKNPPER